MKILIFILLSVSIVYPNLVVYEDGNKDGGLRGKWTSSNGQLPQITYHKIRGTKVLNIKYENLYKLKSIKNSIHNVIQWDMALSGRFNIYVRLKILTKRENKKFITYRTIMYYPSNYSSGLKNSYINIGIGHLNDGTWHTIRRDLIKDLHDYDPNSQLLEVEEFMIRGSGQIDNIEMLDYRNYEDGNGWKNWHIFGDTYKSSVKSVYDKYLQSKVIKLSGNEKRTGYRLAFFDTKKFKSLQWSSRFQETFTVYIKVITKDGIRYICYNDSNNIYRSSINKNYLYFGLGKRIIDDHWHTVTRNLEKDLKRFEPNNSIIGIYAFLIRGTGFISNINLLQNCEAQNDPVYSHKHYVLIQSGLSTYVRSQLFDYLIARWSGRHHKEENEEEAIVLYFKLTTWSNWRKKIILRGKKGTKLGSPYISPHPYRNDLLILSYNMKETFGSKKYSVPHIDIINLKNNTIIKSIKLKGILPGQLVNGNILFTPTGKILISTYGTDDIYVYRSIEAYDNDILIYSMKPVAHFYKKGEIYIEPTMSYVFNKLVIAIRKDIKWFNVRDHEKENYTNIKGELKYISDLEGGYFGKKWITKKLIFETHGMFMPAYQGDFFTMLVSNGGNRQYVSTINSQDFTLNNLTYNSKAFYIKYRRGGGYPAMIRNEDELLVIYWEETEDLRRTHTIQRKVR